jgi:ketosteroid isomerase-like protein
MKSENLRRVKQAWQRLEGEGHARGMDELFEHCHPECVFRPAASRGEVLHGVENARSFFRDQRNAGGDVKVSPYSFREKGDRIEVLGWIRLILPDGGMADSQGRWTYRFRNGQIVEADYSPATTATA